MIEMTRELNAKYFSGYTPAEGESSLGRVTCYTCHQGSTQPLKGPAPAGRAYAERARRATPPGRSRRGQRLCYKRVTNAVAARRLADLIDVLPASPPWPQALDGPVLVVVADDASDAGPARCGGAAPRGDGW